MLKYQFLVDRLRSRVLAMRDVPGGRLPTLGEMAREEGFSLTTVQRAVLELKREGLVVTRTGQGIFPAPLAAQPAAGNGNGHAPELNVDTLPLRFVSFAGYFTTMLASPMGAALFNGLEKILARTGQPILYQNVSLQGNVKPLNPDILAQQHVCGTVCLSPYNDTYLAGLAAHCRPLVCVDKDATWLGVNSIVTDNTRGAFLVTSKLIEMGHRNIAYLGADQLNIQEGGLDPAIKERFQAFRMAHLSKDLPLNEALCQKVPSLAGEGVQAGMAELLARKIPFTALVAYDEGVGRIAEEMLAASGRRVPLDCALAAAGAADPNSTIGGAYFDIGALPALSLELLKEARERNGSGLPQRQTGVLHALEPRFEARATILERQF